MADVVIPVDSADPHYTLDVTLSGIAYRLSLDWNTRGGFWALGIYDQTGAPIVLGVKIVADWELLARFANSRLPPGLLFCVDTSGQGLDPTDSDLGTRVLLVYDDGQ